MTTVEATVPESEITLFDVLIIGCGPVGQTLANLLGLYNLKVCIIDREQSHYPLPRAVHFDSEVMRVFQTTGLAQRIAEVSRVNPGMLFRDRDNNLLLDWSRPMQKSDQQWHASYRFHQPDLESILLDGLQRFANVHLYRGIEFKAFEKTDSKTAIINHCQNNAKELIDIKARYVVGCDGANSQVSRQIGIGAEDLGFEERWLVCDLMLKSDDFHLGDYTLQICDSRRPVTYVRTPGKRRRWEIRLNSDEFIDNAVRHDKVWEHLSAWIQPDQASIERAAVYTFRSKIAKQWRSGGVFLAGDAVHQMPPFMGQGMCAGIRDVSNLAWKLAKAILNPPEHAHASADQSADWLDTYQSERKPNVRDYIETSRRDDGTLQLQTPAARLGSSTDNSNCRQSIDQYHKLHQGTLSMQFELHHATVQTDDSRTVLSDDSSRGGYTLYGSCSFLESCNIKPESTALRENVSPDLTGTRDTNPNHNPYLWAVVTEQDSDDVLPYLAKLKVKAVLVRPDRYIAGTACGPDALDTLLGENGLGHTYYSSSVDSLFPAC